MAKLPNPLYLVFTSTARGKERDEFASPDAAFDWWCGSFREAVAQLGALADGLQLGDDEPWVYQIVRLTDRERVPVAEGKIINGVLIPYDGYKPLSKNSVIPVPA